MTAPDRAAVRAEAEVARLRAATPADVEWVRSGVCLLCGDGVLGETGEHVDPARHEAEVRRLTGRAARPAPVWDEDTVTEAVARALRDAGLVEVVAVHEGYGAEEVVHSHLRPVVDAVRAVVREHLPVRPDRETLTAAVAGLTRAEWDILPEAARSEIAEVGATAIDALLNEWPGKSRGQVLGDERRRLREALAAEEAKIRGAVDFDRHREDCIGRIDGLRLAARLIDGGVS